MNLGYAKPTVVASVGEAIEHAIARTDPDADHDLPVVAVAAEVVTAGAAIVVAGVEVYTVVTSGE